jgi:hypothetical protein
MIGASFFPAYEFKERRRIFLESSIACRLFPCRSLFHEWRPASGHRRHLESFAREGATHVIVPLEPLTLESIEQFGHIAELVRWRE